MLKRGVARSSALEQYELKDGLEHAIDDATSDKGCRQGIGYFENAEV